MDPRRDESRNLLFFSFQALRLHQRGFIYMTI